MRGTTRLAVMLVAMSGCGGPGGTAGATSGPAAFLGTWDARGQLALAFFTAVGPVTTSLSADGVAAIAAGSRADEIVLSHENGCSVPATVVADRATLAEGSSCLVREGGMEVTVTFHSGTLTRQDDSMLLFNATGQALASSPAAVANGSPGSFSWTSTLTRAR